MNVDEIVYETKTVSCFHVASHRRFMELFTLQKKNGVDYQETIGRQDGLCTACGKVATAVNGRYVWIGFIMDEDDDSWYIQHTGEDSTLLASNVS